MSEFNLSERAGKVSSKSGIGSLSMYLENDVKEFIALLKDRIIHQHSCANKECECVNKVAITIDKLAEERLIK